MLKCKVHFIDRILKLSEFITYLTNMVGLYITDTKNNAIRENDRLSLTIFEITHFPLVS